MNLRGILRIAVLSFAGSVLIVGSANAQPASDDGAIKAANQAFMSS